MTNAELKRSHDAMARFLIRVCRDSDERFSGNRSDIAQRHYNVARRLIKQAGMKYEPRPRT